MLLCLILIVGSGLGIYNISREYAAAIIFTKGFKLINSGSPKLDEGITNINKAATLDKKDSYLRNLSQAFLLKINEILNNQKLTQEQGKAELQRQISSAELSATAATQLNPSNSQNWLQLGNVYENFASISIEGAENLAVLNYQKVAELDPKNPQIPLNIGRVYKSTAEKIKVQISLLERDEKKDKEAINKLQKLYEENLETAIEEFKKSVELKYNFTPAYYLMAQVYETQGKKDEALRNYQIVLQLEPQNEEIRKKIEELNK
jgi:Flp pilus assembly protein TadD